MFILLIKNYLIYLYIVMTNTYHLVNPTIKGDNFVTSFKGKNSIEGAKQAYEALSEHFNNKILQFHFTLQKGAGDKLYHFKVSENRKEDKVQFSLEPFHFIGEDDANSTFKGKLEDFNHKFDDKQSGGKESKSKKHKSKKHKKSLDDSDSSESSISSSSSEFDSLTENLYKRAKRYTPVSQPFYYWWYDPYLYKLDSVFIPTFYPYVTPYIELSLRF